MKKNKWDILLLFLFLSTVFGHLFHWGGAPRYWYPVLPVLLFLTARGISKMPLLLQKIRIPMKVGQRFTIVFIVICFLYSFCFWLPYTIKDYRNSLYARKKIFRAIRNADIHNAIIFIRAEPASFCLFPFFKYSFQTSPNDVACMILRTAGFLKNSPNLNNDVLYAADLGDRNILLMKHYPNRRYFIYEYDFDNEAEKLYEIYKD